MRIKFSDGMEFDTSGVLRVQVRQDGWYVVGEGMLVPVRDHAEGRELIAEIQNKKGGN